MLDNQYTGRKTRFDSSAAFGSSVYIDRKLQLPNWIVRAAGIMLLVAFSFSSYGQKVIVEQDTIQVMAQIKFELNLKRKKLIPTYGDCKSTPRHELQMLTESGWARVKHSEGLEGSVLACGLPFAELKDVKGSDIAMVPGKYRVLIKAGKRVYSSDPFVVVGNLKKHK